MKARKLIEGAAYTPDELKAIGKAFDDAWEQIAPSLSTRPEALEAARLKLANLVLRLAKNGTRGPKDLTEEVLNVMFADPRQL